MTKKFDGKIAIDIRDSEPDWAPYLAPTAPKGEPNILYLVWDDIGIATWDCFGGLVDMPNMRRISERGVRLTQFHTTALCSPTRASLLTGRNPTTVGMATIAEMANGFPGQNCRIPFDTALMSEVLTERGYNTFCVGKWHLTPADEASIAGTKRHWPLGRGFERYYGFIGAETDQWYPELVQDNHPCPQPATPEQGYHLSRDLADKAIEFIRDTKVVAPEKPWFTYLCPGAGHAPHHVSNEWADKYSGAFDMGYDSYREVVLENQKRLGIVPADTELSPANPYLDVTGPEGQAWPFQDTVRPWDSLSDTEKKCFTRMAEVFAGFLSYTDAQIGRVLDYLEQSEQLDNTIIVVISDNGASGEGGPNGTVNEVKFFNGYIDSVEESSKHLHHLGGPRTYNHYPNGWAMAFNTPYKLFKRYASHEGGIADPAMISWPAGIAARGEIRDNYVNVCDITPTVYDLLGIDPPTEVRGIAQQPLDGTSFKATLIDPAATTGKDTQFYTMLGTRGIWHRGWFASAVHPAMPSGWGHFDEDRWELFHLDSDRSQCRDLADAHPEKLEELKAFWLREAKRYNGLPLNDSNVIEEWSRWRPTLDSDRTRFTYHPGTTEVGLGAAPQPSGRSFAVLAHVDIQAAPEGIIFKHGGAHGGHVLFAEGGRLHYIYNFLGEEEQELVSPDPIPPGIHVVGVNYARTGVADDNHTPVGTTTLHVDENVVATLTNMRTQPITFGLTGVIITLGGEAGSTVAARHTAPFVFQGGVIGPVVFDISDEPYDVRAAQLTAAFIRD
jgi:arylsulfatase